MANKMIIKNISITVIDNSPIDNYIRDWAKKVSEILLAKGISEALTSHLVRGNVKSMEALKNALRDEMPYLSEQSIHNITKNVWGIVK